MRIIDFRIRPPFEDFLNTAMYAGSERRDRIARAIGFAPSPAAQAQSVDGLLAEMDRAGITHGVVVGRESGSLGSVDNATVKAFCDQHAGRFIPAASIDPADRKKAMRQIEDCLTAGFALFNMEPGGAMPPMHTDDRRLYPLYALLEDREVPLILMTGGNAGPDISYTAPETLDRVLGDFPKLKIVSSHGNWPWVHQILHVAFRRPNLYLSPDYLLANMPGMDDYVQAANTWLSDRVLYASAFPFAPVDRYCDWFRKLPIAPENLEKIMWANASDLLKLTVSQGAARA
ncbi:amidohydrolase family protein [Methylobacterium brachythecii]|uniref:Amidohydrolase n=1 Tax=Methylobacterium brachythecii TaxID=1176177 RepID=A0A7W6F8U3_9HYPH|nr:amidohydrolase family protein [Methylobacterium brachythecii]MBB3904818.1 hypothetical protein [Methylobacterium brachythecii]GLS45370.1 amidohydrolase [Methylobacterium brachythecii]